MQPATQRVRISTKVIWAGRLVSAIPVLLLLFSGAVKVLKLPSVVTGFAHFGYPGPLMVPIGILEIACTLVYVIPRTSVFGAILMAAYLGGATASNVRIGESPIIPAALGVLVWLGLFLCDDRIRALLPLRTEQI